jgi:hypothetical protein
MISAIAIAVVIIIRSVPWRPHSHSIELTAAAMPPLVQLHCDGWRREIAVTGHRRSIAIYPTLRK